MKEPMSCTERTDTIHLVSSQPIVKVLCGAKEHGMAGVRQLQKRRAIKATTTEQADNTKKGGGTVEGLIRWEMGVKGRQIDRDGE